MSFREHTDQNARLVVLKSLNAQVDGRLNDTLISRSLETYGHRWSRDRVRNLLRWLEDMDAIEITEAGTALIAELTQRGLDHVERRAVIEGIDRPSPGG